MFNLTINAVPASTIIVGRRATWLDRHAAEELRDYVKKISGTILNIADETLTMAVTGNRILIGRPSTSDLVKNFADQNPGILPAESDTENDCLAIVQLGEVLVLSGSNDRSVYYSVCHLLQTVFHVGFYWDRDVYEANPDMTVPDNLTIVERSAFKFRHTIGQWVYNHGAFLNEAERREELDKYARNKINSYRLYSWNSYARKMTFIKLGVPGIEIKPEDIARRDIIRDTIEYAQALGIDIMVTLPPDEMTQDFHKLYPNARYFGSEWVKDDNAAPQTKPCLYPEDPMFKTFFQTFVKVWIEEYGPVHNFVASPPCESHISTTIDDYINISVNYSKYTYEAVHELVPEARVFFDGWGVRANTPPCIWTMYRKSFSGNVVQRHSKQLLFPVVCSRLPPQDVDQHQVTVPVTAGENPQPLQGFDIPFVVLAAQKRADRLGCDGLRLLVERAAHLGQLFLIAAGLHIFHCAGCHLADFGIGCGLDDIIERAQVHSFLRIAELGVGC